MTTCDKCRFWTPADFGGECSRGMGFTSPGLTCGMWQARGKAADPKPQAADATGFDVKAAAEKVIGAGLHPVTILTVRDLVRCQYRQAALVVEWLKSTERIRER